MAIVAAETPEAARKALDRIKVRYQVQEPLLDFTKARITPLWCIRRRTSRTLCDVGTDASRNLCSTEQSEVGDVEAELAASEVVLTRTYHTKANSQSMMETFRTFCYLDEYSRLCVVSSTQVPFHVRRILSNALEMKKADIRVIKPGSAAASAPSRAR